MVFEIRFYLLILSTTTQLFGKITKKINSNVILETIYNDFIWEINRYSKFKNI